MKSINLKKNILIFCFTIVSCAVLFSQNRYIDSLEAVIKTSANDTTKVKLYYRLSDKYRRSGKTDSSINCANRALVLANSLPGRGPQILASKVLNLLGAIYSVNSNYKKALEYYGFALNASQKLNDQKEVIRCLTNIGIVYRSQGNYPLALSYYLKALKAAEEINDKENIAAAFASIGVLYDDNNEFDIALGYYFKALQLEEQLNDKENVAADLNNIGNIYAELGKLNLAREYYKRALKTNEELQRKSGIATTLGNLGNLFSKNKKYDVALEYYFKALEINQKLGNTRGIAIKLSNIGRCYLNLGNNKKAIVYLQQAVNLGKQNGELDLIQQFENTFYEVYEKEGQWALALEHYKKFISIRDTLFNEDNTKKTVRLEMNFEFDKKEAAAKLEQEKREAVAKAESNKQKIIIWSVFGILILVIGFAVFAYRSFLQKQKANIEITRQKEIIEEKQKEILDSIRYAWRIQTALLPSEKYIDKNLSRLKKA